MLEFKPSEHLATSVVHGRSLRPQRILATMLAIPTLILLMAGLGFGAEIIRGDFKMLKALPVVAAMAFTSGSLSYIFFQGRGLPTWFLRWVWTMMNALLVWQIISEILEFLRGGNVDLAGDGFIFGMAIFAWISMFKEFWTSK